MLLSIGSRFRFQLDFLTPARALLARFEQMREVAAGRRAIARMDERLLADIGLSRGQALEEVSRRPWDVAPKPRLGLRDI